MPCKHYNHHIQIYAPCCKKYYGCVKCHNRKKDHVFNRKEIYKIRCASCKSVHRKKENQFDRECQSCQHPFSETYCEKCNIWDDSTKKTFHCDDCGTCKIGDKKYARHCYTCNMCFLENTKTHMCSKIDMEDKCPICLEMLFDYKYNVRIMNCNHMIHQKCYKQYIQTIQSTKIPSCPICKKSTINPNMYTETFDQKIKDHPLHPYYHSWKSIIFCNDCCTNSTVNYHTYYHKCIDCTSYNTSVIQKIEIN